MADDVNAALRAELMDRLAVLQPQIRGFHDLIDTSISEDLRAVFRKEIENRERRRDLIQTVINHLDATNGAMTALEADGYPALPNVTISPELFAELRGEEADLDAAVAVFQEPSPATGMVLQLGELTEKPLE